jgi:hypothetical protein
LSFFIARKRVGCSFERQATRAKRLCDSQGEESTRGFVVSWQVTQVFVPEAVRRSGAEGFRPIRTPTGWCPSRIPWHEAQSVRQGRATRGEIVTTSPAG